MQDYKTWVQWGLLERSRGHPDVAERCFQRGLMVAPGNSHLWYLYATMVGKAGKVRVWQGGCRSLLSWTVVVGQGLS